MTWRIRDGVPIKAPGRASGRCPLVEFQLDGRSGVPTYFQLVLQVRQAVRLGILRPGDQLPTVKQVASSLAINANTVSKAYRELDREHLVEARRGFGTFISRDVLSRPPDELNELRSALRRWVERARDEGLDEESMAALFADSVRVPGAARAA